MKLYTKRGDDGGTDLFGGQRVSKDDLRVDAYGTVDELNSILGLAASTCRQEELRAVLAGLQSRLFELGADLATPHAEGCDKAAIARIGAEQIADLEKHIDATCAPLPAMQHFILPGGTETAARLHVARTVCRRAERLCVRLSQSQTIGQDLIIYLNRLSDLLFALARRANQLEGIADVEWRPRG
ncbi:MAG: cob(I)yrinic acid a,c-diamide adenosyltransferase [Phycisphaeraceae bacterium]